MDVAQSSADVYGMALDAACVIILVFTTSIGCVMTQAMRADVMPTPTSSKTVDDNDIDDDNGGDESSSLLLFRLRICRFLNLNNPLLCNISRDANVTITKGTLRDMVGLHPE
jgi:hypothetical protein